MNVNELKKYTTDLNYSYSFGAFVTIELLKYRPKDVFCVLVDESFQSQEAFQTIKKICIEYKIQLVVNTKIVSKLRNKDNCFVIGVFKKYQSNINKNKHIILENVNDFGTIGTIIRSMHGFNFDNLILINCDIDIYHPHIIRSSMGAYFNINIEKFDNIEKYLSRYSDRNIFQCYENGQHQIKDISKKEANLSLWLNPKIDTKYQSINTNSLCSLENNANILFFHFYE